MAEVPGEVGDWVAQEDDIPEMHFPSSEEGAGTNICRVEYLPKI